MSSFQQYLELLNTSVFQFWFESLRSKVTQAFVFGWLDFQIQITLIHWACMLQDLSNLSETTNISVNRHNCLGSHIHNINFSSTFLSVPDCVLFQVHSYICFSFVLASCDLNTYGATIETYWEMDTESAVFIPLGRGASIHGTEASDDEDMAFDRRSLDLSDMWVTLGSMFSNSVRIQPERVREKQMEQMALYACWFPQCRVTAKNTFSTVTECIHVS